MKKELLKAVVVSILAMSGMYSGQATPVSQLDTVYVLGDRYDDLTVMPGGKTDRRIHFGLYGDTDYMEVPANISSYTEKTIKQNYIPARSFMNVVTNNPSVMVGGASTNNNVELQIRGMSFNTHDQLMDGIPGMMAMGIIPMNWVERIDVVTGPNVVLGGTGVNQSVSGFVNIVPKIAKNKSNLDLTETYSSHRLFNHGIDWGQRFGESNRYGIRLNAEQYSGTTSFSGETLKGKDLYIHIDQKTDQSTTSLLFGYDSVVNHGMPEVLNVKENWGNAVTHLPSPKSVVENFQPRWTDLSHQRHVYTVSHEQKLNSHIKAYVKGGYQKLTWPGYWDQKPVLLNDAGDYNFGKWGFGGDQDSKWTRRALSTGFLLEGTWGATEHKVNLGYEILSNSWYYITSPKTERSKPEGNIYTGKWTVNEGAPFNHGGPWYRSSRILDRSIVISDTVTALDGDLKVVLGARRQNIQTKGYNSSGVQTKSYDKTRTSPSIGVVYKLNPRMSLYGSYAEGLTVLSPIGGTLNEKDVFEPVQTKQYEWGGKWDFGNWGTTLSYFHITKPEVVANASNYSVLDGKTVSKGLEWNIFGKVAPHLTATGGVMYVNAKYEKALSEEHNGNRVHGTPHVNATLALDWETPVEGLTLTGRTLYMGNSFADTANKIRVPSWTRFDVGATYETKIASVPMTLFFNAYNVFDRKYWSTATTKWADGMVMLNPGRTYVFSASVHL